MPNTETEAKGRTMSMSRFRLLPRIDIASGGLIFGDADSKRLGRRGDGLVWTGWMGIRISSPQVHLPTLPDASSGTERPFPQVGQRTCFMAINLSSSFL